MLLASPEYAYNGLLRTRILIGPRVLPPLLCPASPHFRGVDGHFTFDFATAFGAAPRNLSP